MTLIEVAVAMGLASILVLALGEMTVFSSRASKSEDSVAELNRIVGLLVTAINSQHPYNGDYNAKAYSQSGGCNQIFYQMPVSSVTTLPGQSISPLTNNYAASITPGGTFQTIIQTTPGLLPTNATNNLLITAVGLILIEGPINSRPDGSLAYLYDVEINAQKTNIAGQVQVGGNKSYTKDIFVELWRLGNVFVGCS